MRSNTVERLVILFMIMLGFSSFNIHLSSWYANIFIMVSIIYWVKSYYDLNNATTTNTINTNNNVRVEYLERKKKVGK